MTEVTHNLEKQLFEFSEGEFQAYLGYKQEANEMVIYTTQVPKELGGRGVASLLTKTALDYAVANGLKIVPLCSFVETYIERHKDYQDYL
ncbi:MAG: GNAT family N-acetyltransferase [Alphaproteobacteria bacterium]|nr:GNAT family N-acetyltransferase [Alphaproteobacteria bacterium]